MFKLLYDNYILDEQKMTKINSYTLNNISKNILNKMSWVFTTFYFDLL